MLVNRFFFVIHITNTRIAFVGCAFSSGIEGSDISVLIAERRTVTSSSEGWKDTELGWLQNKGSHRDTVFQQSFKIIYSYAGLLVASKSLFRKYFTQEKLR